MKTAMQNLSERLEKTIKYYDDTHGVPSSYHFRMLKNLVDTEYLLEEKQQIAFAYQKGRMDIVTKQPVISMEQYYNDTYKTVSK